MLLLTILLLVLVLLMVITIFAISVGGTVFIILFGDVIVCMGVIVWLIVRLVRKKKKK